MAKSKEDSKKKKDKKYDEKLTVNTSFKDLIKVSVSRTGKIQTKQDKSKRK